MEFIEIERIEEFEYTGLVYDLTVEEDESYNIESIIVHNSACTTSANSSTHYPMASLIRECYEISATIDTPSKIVADGGFKKYADIIKAIGLGADSVMLGGIINKSLESCSPNYILKDRTDGYVEISIDEAREFFKNGVDVYKYFRGMSTKEVQKKWGNERLKTSEGITKYNKVEYTLDSWTENFEDYLKSTMSYSNKRDLNSFIGNAEFIFITSEAFNRFDK